MVIVESKLSRSARRIYYVQGKRASKAQAEFDERMNQYEYLNTVIDKAEARVGVVSLPMPCTGNPYEDLRLEYELFITRIYADLEYALPCNKANVFDGIIYVKRAYKSLDDADKICVATRDLLAEMLSSFNEAILAKYTFNRICWMHPRGYRGKEISHNGQTVSWE